LGAILKETKKSDWNLTTMLLVGKALGRDAQTESSLYSKDFTHIFRVVKKKKSAT
jgi:precorrin-4/cobalt-precorrin-4 C11-methyltransferase